MLNLIIFVGIPIFLTLLAIMFVSAHLPMFWGAPWVPTSLEVAKKMLSMANLQAGQKVVDLGAGDGRIVIVAARQFKAQVVGVEIDPIRCLIANALILLFGVRQRATVHHGNLFDFDFQQADVVTLCLLPDTNQRLKPLLTEQLPSGAKIVSYLFPISGWTPIAIDNQRGIFLYEIGKTGRDVRPEFV